MTQTLRFILGDQLSRDISSLQGVDKAHDVILMAEVREEATYVRHHKRKIAFLFSAMRHFADGLRREGFAVRYHRYGEPGGPASFTEALTRAVAEFEPGQVRVTEPGEWRVLAAMRGWADALPCRVDILPDDRFFCTRDAFVDWAGLQRSGLRMEFFYREMRKQTGLLMSGGLPEGGAWNFDKQNRAALPKRLPIPQRPSFPPDETTEAVLGLVAAEFADHFGDLANFAYPVTRADALNYLDWFIETALPSFGTYQDALKQGEPLLFHSHLSALVNCGLLTPREVCRRAESAFHEGGAPINAVEGFVRQILGWREYIRGVYWLKMPDYGGSNQLGATRKLPPFFWTGETDMNCLAQSFKETRRNAYNHHIQRLMVIGNFCLIAGLDPREVQEWYLIVYHDAYEWVEMPNVVGMILFTDGGLMASKPYAASGAYIDRMSDYCGKCRFDVRQKTGPDACPYNYLYWDFLARHRSKFGANKRMEMMYVTLDRMDEGRQAEIAHDARVFLDGLEPAGDNSTPVIPADRSEAKGEPGPIP